jgi:hypothetical protein
MSLQFKSEQYKPEIRMGSTKTKPHDNKRPIAEKILPTCAKSSFII